MAGASGVTIGSAVSDQEAGSYSLVGTTATSGSGSGLTLNFVVEADGSISTSNFNIISRGVNYEIGDTFTIDDHGSAAVMSVATVSATIEDAKHNRYYVRVQPNNQAGPPTYNLSDRDVEGTTGGGPGPSPGGGTIYTFEGEAPIVTEDTDIGTDQEHIKVSLDIRLLGHR